ncbi:aldehyde dehydrogenase family protein [Actinocorallia longicatena]|uniref:Aldehyde dehydrogenase n=1 Tax=Actinocorallia longicatena TaxID=111803 RepID=A0ABP6QIB7_9ACTN
MSVTTEAGTFESLNPATGAVVGTHPIHDEKTVFETVERAQAAARWWAGLGWKERKNRLLRFKGALARNLNRISQVIHEETGKPIGDAVFEAVGAINLLDWAAKNAQKTLGPRSVFPGALSINQKAILEYHPLGVVGVIGPWNYPIYTPMGSLAFSLAAGNAVVFKPSEHTPGVGVLLAELFAEVVPERPVFQVVTGFGATGGALTRAGVNKIAFTGSGPTAKKVMAACAETLTPIVAECGGKDAFIIAADADLEEAAKSALWGAMSNAGQTCVGVERIYVVESVYEEFLGKLSARAEQLKAGYETDGTSFGPITMPGQLDIIERHITDALAAGGRAVVGGAESVRRPFVDPVVLVDVPDTASAICEETFGPTVTVTKVKSLDEAVAKANATEYGLASTVFTSSSKTALDVARRLRSGMTSINAAIAFALIPALPFGGVGESGFGRIHGADGLREFARPKAITRQRFKSALDTTTFTRTQKEIDQIIKLMQFLHGRKK